MNTSNAFADFESFMSSSLATDLSMELQNMIHPNYPSVYSKRKPVQEDDRLHRLEHRLSTLQNQLLHQTPVEPLADTDSIANKLQEMCRQLDNLKSQMGQLQVDLPKVSKPVQKVAVKSDEMTQTQPVEKQVFEENGLTEEVKERIQEYIKNQTRSTSPDKSIASRSKSPNKFKQAPTPVPPTVPVSVPKPLESLSEETKSFISQEIARQLKQYEETRLMDLLVELSSKLEQRLAPKTVRWDSKSVRSASPTVSIASTPRSSRNPSQMNSGRSTPVDKDEQETEKLLRKLRQKLDKQKAVQVPPTKKTSMRSSIRSNYSLYTKPTMASQLKTKAFK